MRILFSALVPFLQESNPRGPRAQCRMDLYLV